MKNLEKNRHKVQKNCNYTQEYKEAPRILDMPLKRASRGRTKGGKGSTGVVQCTNCGQTVPKDKAKKVTSKLNLVEHTLAKELRAQGAYIASPTVLKHYCISCAIHFKILKIRSADNRRQRGKLR